MTTTTIADQGHGLNSKTELEKITNHDMWLGSWYSVTQMCNVIFSFQVMLSVHAVVKSHAMTDSQPMKLRIAFSKFPHALCESAYHALTGSGHGPDGGSCFLSLD